MTETLIHPADLWHDHTGESAFPMLVAGEWRHCERTLEVRSPFDGRVLSTVSAATADVAREAIDAGEQALEAGLPAHERAPILDRAARVIERRFERFASVLVDEAGKPDKAARIEVERAIGTFRFAAAEARRLRGHVVPIETAPPGAGRIAFTRREPVGVVGAITPFNFPVNLVAHKLAPAVAAGCPVVLKPASQTPVSSLLLAAALLEAGLPGQFLSVLPGRAAEIGDVLVDDDRVTLITFTGSPDVGWQLRARAPRKRVALELGNNSPAIVAADGDLEHAVERLVANAFSYAGQSCISVQRVYVEDPIFEPFLERFASLAGRLRCGDPAAPDTDVGPVVDERERERIVSWIDEAKAAGASVVTGGEVTDGILAPTVLTGVPAGASVSCREVFGPVVSIERCASVAAGLEAANASVYGLQAAIFTSSLATAFAAAGSLRYAGVIVNDAPTFRSDQMPYGGRGESGNTKEGPAYAIEEMTEEKLVVIDPRTSR